MKNFEEVNFSMINDLKKHIKRFKSKILDLNFEKYCDLDNDEIVNLFMIYVVENTFLMKKYKKILLDLNHDEKEINHLFYFYLKSNYKHENKLFSWFEYDELDLPYDDFNSTLTYTIL